jgi:hypothetical protein
MSYAATTSMLPVGSLFEILVVALIVGAGGAAAFSLGIRLLSAGQPQGQPRRVAPLLGAAVAFAIDIAVIGFGLYLIVKGH